MTNIQVFLNHASTSQETFHDNLKSISERISRSGIQLPAALLALRNYHVVDVAIGPNHIAFLLSDGRVCRISFTIHPEKLSAATTTTSGSTTSSRKRDARRRNNPPDSNSSGGSGNAAASSGNISGSGASNQSSVSTARDMRSSRFLSHSFFTSTRGRGLMRDLRRGLLIPPSRSPMVPASEVPEELVQQAQAVLQGKSRQVIIRELQRTSLDVNMAVNNLLSRDDEGGEEQAIGGSGGSGGGGNLDEWEDDIPDDLVPYIESAERAAESSYLMASGAEQEASGGGGGGSGGLPIADDLFSYAGPHSGSSGGSGRARWGRITAAPNIDDPDGDGGRTIRGSKRRRLEISAMRMLGSESSPLADESREPVGRSKERTSGGGTASDSVQESPASSAIQFGEELQFWLEKDGTCPTFSAIGALYSELVAVSISGQLHQWRWNDSEPFVGSSSFQDAPHTRLPRHPRAPWLGVERERIQSLSCCLIRASLLTESGQVATWLDEIVAPLSSRLEHPVSSFESEIATGDRIVGIRVASLVTVANTSSGLVYWWGVLPGDSRRKVFDKARHKATGTASSNSNSSRTYSQTVGSRSGSRANQTNNTTTGSFLVPGAYVSMKNAPVFHAGAIGFTIVDGVPKVGVLLEDAWNMSAICRFRIKNAVTLATEREKKASNIAPVVNPPQANPPPVNPGQFSPAPPMDCNEKMETDGTASSSWQNVGWRDVTAVEPPGNDVTASNANSGPASIPAGSSSEADKIDMPPPPSPASSTCSDQSGPILISPGSLKRKKATTPLRDIPSSEANFSQAVTAAAAAAAHNRGSQNGRSASSAATLPDVVEEEEWCLSGVIFLEDGRSQPVGRVLKMDGNIVAVRFMEPSQTVCPPSTDPPTPADPSLQLLNDCRLLKRDDLVLVKNPTSSRSPDFYQRTPRRLPIPSALSVGVDSGSGTGQLQVLTFSITNSDLHLIVRSTTGTSVKLSYQVYTLYGKHVHSLRLMTHGPAFTGASLDNVRLISSGEVEKPMLLMDGNSCIYAMHKLGSDSMSPPGWLDLPALRCASIATIPIPRSINNQQTNASNSQSGTLGGRGVLTVLGLEAYSLMPHILRCDFERVREILSVIHAKPDGEEKAALVADIMAERCDGHRNILHVAIAMCTPQSNREMTEESAGDESGGSASATSGGSNSSPAAGTNGGNSVSISGSNVSSARIRRISVQPANDSSGSVHDVFIRRVHSRYQEMRRQLNQQQQQVQPQQSQSSPQQQQSQQPQQQQAPTQQQQQPPPPPPSQQQTPLIQAMQQGWRQAAVVAGSSLEAGSSGSVAGRRSEPIVPQLGHSVTISSSLLAVAAVAAQDAGLNRPSDLSQTTGQSLGSAPGAPNQQWYLPPVVAEETELRENARQIVSHICRHPLFETDSSINLFTLLFSTNVHGHTPFQHAIACRAYPVANAIFDVITELAAKSPNAREVMMSAIFPPGSAADDSPLHMLCHNDTCTFTWTGPDHIRQDIFECRTCGLMDSLCCCTECARVCHRGHDCRLKRTSPTAYCDCWEKCRCKALVAGSQSARQVLLTRLLSDTDLAVRPNRRGEHILLFLVKTVGRQLMEQRNFRPHRRRALHQRYPSIIQMPSPISFEFHNEDSTLPEHDLEPPKFCRRALELVLSNWQAVESMLLGEHKGPLASDPSVPRDMEDLHLHYQSGAIHLDQFVFGLMSGRCSPESGHVLDTLLCTLIREMQAEPGSERAAKARLAAARLVRAVIRLYLLLSLQVTPNHARPKGFLNSGLSYERCHQPLDLCCRVFVCLITVALEELPRQADALFAPVRLGVVRPTNPFQLHTQVTDALPASEQLFAADPLLAPVPISDPPLPSRPSTLPTRSLEPDSLSGELQMEVDDVLESDSDSEPDTNFDSTTRRRRNATESSIELDDGGGEDSTPAQASRRSERQSASGTSSSRRRRGNARQGGGSSRVRSFSSPTSPNYSDASDSDPPSPTPADQESQHNSDDDDEEEEMSPDEDSFIYEPPSPQYGLLSPDDFLGQLLSNRTSGLSSFPTTTSNNASANLTSSGMAWAVRGGQRGSGESRDRPFNDSSSAGATGGSGGGGVTSGSGGSGGGNTGGSGGGGSGNRSSSGVRLISHMITGAPSSGNAASGSNSTSDSVGANSSLLLARGFAILVRLCADLLNLLPNYHTQQSSPLSEVLHFNGYAEATRLQRDIEVGFKDIWRWLAAIMDAAEAQLRYGNSLNRFMDSFNPSQTPQSRFIGGYSVDTESSSRTDSSRPRSRSGAVGGAANAPQLPGESSRREFLSYMLSLMRGASDEHADLLPMVDLGAYRHVAYVTDAFLYLIKETVDGSVSGGHAGEGEEEEDSDERPAVRRSHVFFQRSPSTLALGCPGPDPIQTPLESALPLAFKPHLLNPGSRRQDLFGVAQPSNIEQDVSSLRYNRNDAMPIHLGLVSSWADREGLNCDLRPADLLSRWHLTLEMFGRLFAEEVGAEPRSTILELGGFPVKESRFRKEMERIRNQSRRDLCLDVDRDRNLLIAQTFRQLNAEFFKRQGGASTPLQCHRMKVTFKDEPGEGSGVARSFFTAFAQGILSEEPLPPLESVATRTIMPTPRYSLVGRSGRRSGIQMSASLSSNSVSRSGPSSLQQSAIRRVASAMAAVPGLLARRSEARGGPDSPSSTGEGRGEEISLLDTILSSDEAVEIPDTNDDLSPLFWQPGKPGFYSPRMARMSMARQMAYRNVGRVIGLCLLMGEICPLRLNRHVLKFLMGRTPQWHDMAFFDPSMYEGMRQLLVMADQNNAEAIRETELFFTIRLGGEEGPGEQIFDLIPDGNSIRVTIDNVFDYVRRYCDFRLIRCVKDTLEQMRLGLYDVLPTNAFEGVTAEDLRLLLNGAGEIDISTLQSYTVFSDESGETNKKVTRFKKWFWQCLERMSQTQRQDLVYFWTSSPALPASEQGFQPSPSVTVRPADDHHLPTANTCISRLYIPLYSSKSLLRTKLLQAIETKSFGFV